MRRRQYRLPGGACIHIIPADRSIRPRYFAFLHQQFLSQCNEQGHSQSGKRRLQRNNVGCRRFVMAAKNRHHGSNACRRRTGRNHCHHGDDATNAGEVQRQHQQQRKYHRPLYRGNPNSGAFSTIRGSEWAMRQPITIMPRACSAEKKHPLPHQPQPAERSRSKTARRRPTLKELPDLERPFSAGAFPAHTAH